ncbi:porin [Acinetobacter populi]|nr:porin [Acinetobacter populi]
MKTQKISLAIALAFISGTTFAAPTLYGVLDLSANFADKDAGHTLTTINDGASVSSNNSYIGIKGSEKLTDTLSVVYDAQWTVNTDGDGTDLGQRDRYLGLKHEQLGTLSFGKVNTFLKRLGGVDLFDNYAGNQLDIQNTFTGENRVNNAVQYQSPTFNAAAGKINVGVQLFQGEDAKIVSSGNAVGNSFGDAISASVTYDNKDAGFNLGLAYDSAVPSRWIGASNAWAETNTIRATGTYNIANLSLRALVQRAEIDEASTASSNVATVSAIDDELGFALGAVYKIADTAWSVKGQYQQGTTSYKTSASDVKAQQIAAGVDYQYNSNAKAYAFLAQNKLVDDKNTVGGLGFQYKF